MDELLLLFYAKLKHEIESMEASEDTILDRQISVTLLLNYIRQHEDAWVGFKETHGTVDLTNTQEYPFNDSMQTVALGVTMPDTVYAVIARVVTSSGDAGDVVVADKLTNGFKIGYTGSAKSATVEYIVIGGFTV